jgi:hypothetical protein
MDASGPVDDEGRARLAHQIEDLLRQRQYRTALPLAIELASRTSRECGEESPEYSHYMLRVADAYRASGRFAEAHVRESSPTAPPASGS